MPHPLRVMLKLILLKGVGLPLYEYRCRKCGKVVEKIQKFSDPLLKTCESCGGKLEQVISAPAFQFKGTGWYVTDYARKSLSESSSPKSDGASSKTSESKPAAPASESKAPVKK
jgi:putative FmdB family regulatory protein